MKKKTVGIKKEGKKKRSGGEEDDQGEREPEPDERERVVHLGAVPPKSTGGGKGKMRLRRGAGMSVLCVIVFYLLD